MAGTVVADTLQADSTSTLVLKNGVANTPPTIQDSAGTQIGTFCRAWVAFDGTGTFSPNPSTTKIRASFNVSSILDNGTGDYTINFTNALSDVNYAASGACNTVNNGSNFGWFWTERLRATGSYRLVCFNTAGTLTDMEFVSASFFR